MAVVRRRILSGGVVARKALWRIALDTSAKVADRRQAVVTLEGNIQDQDLQGLAGLAEDPAAELRLEAAMGLGQIENAESTKMLKQLALDPEESVRLSAQAVLERRTATPK
jgi:HEAT repeat protein